MSNPNRNKEGGMEWKDVVPWNWGRKSVPVSRRRSGSPSGAFLGLPEEMNSFFDRFFADTPWPAMSSAVQSGFSPSVDVSENDKQFQVSVEVPGMTQENLHLTIDDDHLIIEGEKKDENERTEGKVHYKESSFGRFQRVLPLPQYVDVENIQASSKNGVLTISIPKLPEAASKQRTISVKHLD